ncbi:MAG TPA: type IV toxin-antitoxin system AbiEi family antitoxin [Candidatus Aminicenantes bacterium]|nr:type IV toxin-antitoxin system AbiEi family antitoxin [Candidatus Aminicenantes bacterium]
MKTPQRDARPKLLEEAARAFNQRFKGLKGLEMVPEWPEPTVSERRHDARMNLISGKKRASYTVAVKSRISHALRHLLLMQERAVGRPMLLVTDYANPEMAEQLIKDGLEFIDAAGNAFINLGFLKIISKGNPPKSRVSLASPRLFRASGLKVVFALLSQPDLVFGSFREIATGSGVSLGTAAVIMDELKSRLYLIEDGRGTRRLIRKKELFESWVTAYPEQLRPKIFLGRYRGEHGWWHDLALEPNWAQWGGEIAASRFTNYLFPQLVTVYLSAPRLNDFLMSNKLALDKNGNVEILERFWPADVKKASEELVHPFLIYADLMASGSDRNIETAKDIYDRHIARHLRED